MGEGEGPVGPAVGIMGRRVEDLLAQTRDEDPGERLTALRLLAEHAPDVGLPALQAACADGDAGVRRFARQEVERLHKEGGGASPALQAPAAYDALKTLRVTLWGHVGLWLLCALAGALQRMGGREGDIASLLFIPHRSPLWEVTAAAFAWGALRSLSHKKTLDSLFFQTLTAAFCTVTFPAGFVFGPWILYRTWRPRA